MTRRGVTAGIDIEHALGLELQALWGGYPSESSAEELTVRVGVPLDTAPLVLCPYASLGYLAYDFRDTHDVDRGTVGELSTRLGVAVGVPPPLGAGPRLGGVLALEYVHRYWDMDGRDLVLQDGEYTVALTHRIDRTHHLSGRAAAMLRWGRIGMAAGVGTHPRTGPDFVAFLNVGVAVLRLRPRGER